MGRLKIDKSGLAGGLGECSDSNPQPKVSLLNQKIEKSVQKNNQNKNSNSKQKSYSLDLRIHTPSSLGCFSIEGIDTAPALLSLAKVKGIDVIAITDLFSADYIDKMVEASKSSKITVIPGVDLRCRLGKCDDVTLTCLFPENYKTESVNNFLFSLGINHENPNKGSTILDKDFAEILNIIEEFQGTVFPSRIDKTPSRLTVLSTLVEKYGFRTFDLAYNDSEKIFKDRWPDLKFNLLSFSNAYALAQIGTRTTKMKMVSPTFESVKSLFVRNY